MINQSHHDVHRFAVGVADVTPALSMVGGASGSGVAGVDS
jgi:hypothetical protein